MYCPRCKLPLRRVDYEGVDADMCDNCWGFWLDTGELEQVLDRRDLEFSPAERAQILEVRYASKTGATTPVQCPRCEWTMGRVHHDESVHLVIDCCSDHGVWLDTGEIKKVQALAEKSAVIHSLLIKKLGIRPRN